MRRTLAAVLLLLAACGPAHDRVTVDTSTTQRPATPETWRPLPNDPPGLDDPLPPPEHLPPATAGTVTTQLTAQNAFDQAMTVVLAAYDWTSVLPSWSIERHPAQEGLLARTFVLERRIEVYAREGESVEHQAYVIAHEVGHAVDIERVSPFERAVWAANRGYGLTGWFPKEGVSDFASGAGDFAESFAHTLVPCDECWSSELGKPPTPAERLLLDALVR